MLNKTMIALSAIAMLASVSAASADPSEQRLSDRFPFLEKTYHTAQIAGRNMVARQSLNKASPEASEQRVADRYPFLEPGINVAAVKVVGRNMAAWQKFTQVTKEDSEQRVGDRYPYLEQIAQARSVVTLTSGRSRVHAQKQTVKNRG